MEKDIESLKLSVGPLNVQAELTQLKQVIANMEKSNLERIEEIIEEINNRNSKSLNFLIFNLIDTNDKAKDIKNLQKIFTAVPIDPKDLFVARLGLFQENKDRPILLKTRNKAELKLIFDNKKLITAYMGNLITRKSIGLSSDKTRIQRETLKEVLTDLNTRKANGEADITLKYRNGAPKIVKIKKKSIQAEPTE